MTFTFSDDTNRDSLATTAVPDEPVSPAANKEGEVVADEDERVYPGEGEEAIKRDETDEFPDGGLRAWLVVVGGVCITFASFGFVNAWGVFQDYYETTLLPDVSPSTIAWIGSIQYSLTFLPGLFTGRLFDLGYFHLPLGISSAVLVVSAFLVAECKEYWHFVLAQGIVVGLGSGWVFGPTMAVVSHWWHKKRSMAFGIVAIGSSLGGTVLPIAVSKLLPLVGFPWTMRIIGFILLGATGFANLVMKRRLPPVNVKGGLVNPAAFKNITYTLYTAATCVTFLGLYTALTYFNVSAQQPGISPSLAPYIVSIANAASTFGRLSSGLLADGMGPVNVLIPFTALAAVTTYVWPYCTTTASIVVIAVIYGFASGAYVGLMGAPLAEMGLLTDMGRRMGMTLSIAAFFALTGPPISGAIYDMYGSFHPVGWYAGSMVIASCVLLIASKYAATRSLFAKY
ncbi:MFS general substrate transporter [Dacryopinax primogenitus]|uniref:MFS general substrate transporter n=1 Tax=Dacryopinax primogenitus (strain DJM 731) TaxID=1858805 RepID=M5FY84_DACPD|nr:MFS general substrate transporter [Dacryopinax primogenitus]EJU01494.1 MFS general substrate transporter [Dacryopinax primogenitus]